MRSIEKKIYLGLLVCLLVSVVGTSFAYFVTSTAIGGEGGKTSATTADLIHVKFDAGDTTLDLQDVTPGGGKEKDFSVIITPTNNIHDVTYAIMLDISSNDFVKCSDDNYKVEEPDKNVCVKNAEELVYTLKDENDNIISTGDLLEKNDKLLLAKITKENINSETIYRYSLNITFKNTNSDQNHNANKTFRGNIEVEFAQTD